MGIGGAIGRRRRVAGGRGKASASVWRTGCVPVQAAIARSGGAPQHGGMTTPQGAAKDMPRAPAPRRSLSWRLVGLALAAMAATELLLFLPAMLRERQEWLDGRLLAAQIAVHALPSGPSPGGLAERAAREEVLRLAGVLSVRLQEPGRPMVMLAPMGPVHASALLDLRAETTASRLGAVLASLGRPVAGRPVAGQTVAGRTVAGRTVLVMAPSPKRPQAMLSVVLAQGELDAHLRASASAIALHALAVAVPTGVLTYVALLLLLVRPLRRLTAGIAAFRADPERTPPPAPGRRPDDEVGVAQRELAAMQAELRAALWRNARLAAIGAAVAKVSHDLRGILAPALLGAERLQASGDPALRRTGDSIAHTVERATTLMRDTLDFAAVVPASSLLPVALRELALEVAEEIRLRHPATAARLEVDAGLSVRADRASLRRALVNLVRNAAEAGAATVTVAAAAVGNNVAVTVADDGPGLPEEVRARLFQPFVTSGKPGGTGLGLAITRDLMRAQGGAIELAQSGADGTTFRLVLRREDN